MSHAREQMEASADRIRGELERTLSELDRRRHSALDIRAQIHRHAGALWLAGGVVALLVAAVVTAGIARSKSRPARLWRQRRKTARRLWNHPWQLARPAPRPIAQVGSKVAAATLAALGVQLSKRAVRYLMSEGENAGQE